MKPLPLYASSNWKALFSYVLDVDHFQHIHLPMLLEYVNSSATGRDLRVVNFFAMGLLLN